MTAKEILDKYYPYPNDFHEGCAFYKAMQEFARIKCLEAIKNTRYKSIELIQDHVSCDLSLIREIQNIRNQDVMPKL